MEFKGTKGVYELVGNEIHCDGKLIGYATNEFFKSGEDDGKAKYNAKLFSCSLEILETLSGLVSDVQNLVQEHDIEWQQAGYYNHAVELIKKATKI